MFDSARSKVGNEFLVNTTTEGNQWTPIITGLTGGDFVIAWDDDGNGIKAQIFGTNDHAPVITNALVDQNATEDSLFSFQVPADAFNDLDAGDTLSYAATLADGGALPSWLSFDASTRTFSGTPLNDDVGTILVKVTATDSSS